MVNETVSKTKSAEKLEAAEVATLKERKTLTDWSVFEKGGLVPVRIRCEGYMGSHPSDLSCHSNLLLTGEAVLNHMQPDHSGGWFKFKFRISDGKVSPIWGKLADAGVEISDLYCSHCRTQVAMTPRNIIKHLQPHAGATRINPDPQSLCFSLTTNKADLDEYDELYDTTVN